MLEIYPHLEKKCEVIPNGFDLTDVRHDEANTSNSRCVFYAGTIDEETTYTPLPILELLSKLAIRGKLCELHYAGHASEAFRKLVRRAGFPFGFTNYGYLDHATYYRVIQRMKYVMLCMPREYDSRSWIPARVYDYIGSKSRIICLAPRESELSRLLERYGRCLRLYYDEPEEVQVEKLWKYLSEDEDLSEPSEEFVSCFSRNALAQQLGRVFDKVSK